MHIWRIKSNQVHFLVHESYHSKIVRRTQSELFLPKGLRSGRRWGRCALRSVRHPGEPTAWVPSGEHDCYTNTSESITCGMCRCEQIWVYRSVKAAGAAAATTNANPAAAVALRGQRGPATMRGGRQMKTMITKVSHLVGSSVLAAYCALLPLTAAMLPPRRTGL